MAKEVPDGIGAYEFERRRSRALGTLLESIRFVVSVSRISRTDGVLARARPVV